MTTVAPIPTAAQAAAFIACVNADPWISQGLEPPPTVEEILDAPAPKRPKARIKATITNGAYGDDDHMHWLRQVIDFDNRCDRVPSLNGVREGMTFRNRHTGSLIEIECARLGGWSVHSGHDSVLISKKEDDLDYYFGGCAWTLSTLREHWQLVELVDEKWKVLPHPLSRQRLDRDAWSAVVHQRPQGEYVEWKGERRTTWRLHWNRVLLRNGISIAQYKGMTLDWVFRLIAERFPDSAPGPIGDTTLYKKEAA